MLVGGPTPWFDDRLGRWQKAIGSVFKAILKSPIFRAILQIAICATPGVNMFGCAGASGLLTLASGGSALDAVKAFAFSFAQMGAFTEVSSTLNGLQAGNMVLGTLVKAGVHGIIGGAMSLAQGGSFLQGFAGSAVGAIGGAIAGQSGLVGQYGDGDSSNMLARALISGAAGCAGAVVTGGKCAQAAVTAAFASLYNDDSKAYNHKQGNFGKAQAALQVQARNFIVIGEEVDVWVPGLGIRRYDLLVQNPDTMSIYGVEVKSTIGQSISLNSDQVEKDVFVVAGARGRYPASYVSGTEEIVQGVWYEATCFGCKTLNIDSWKLESLLRLARIPVYRCDTPSACRIR